MAMVDLRDDVTVIVRVIVRVSKLLGRVRVCSAL